jgi:hypothetical protein
MFGTNCAVNVVTEFVEYYMAEDDVPYEPDGERPTFRGVNDLVYSNLDIWQGITRAMVIASQHV